MPLLLPKLRSHFAEFLQHNSPKRLNLLNLFTCVGLEYGFNINRLFLENSQKLLFNPLNKNNFRILSPILKYEFLPIKLKLSFFSQGPFNPRRISLFSETLNLRRQCFTHCLSLLISTFSILISSIYVTINLL